MLLINYFEHFLERCCLGSNKEMRSQFSDLIRTISLAKKPLCLKSVSEKSVFWFSWQNYKTSNWYIGHLMWLSFSWYASSCANDTKFIKKHNRFSMVRGLSNNSEICLPYDCARNRNIFLELIVYLKLRLKKDLLSMFRL